MQQALFIQCLQFNILVNYLDKENETVFSSFKHKNKLKFDSSTREHNYNKKASISYNILLNLSRWKFMEILGFIHEYRKYTFVSWL